MDKKTKENISEFIEEIAKSVISEMDFSPPPPPPPNPFGYLSKTQKPSKKTWMDPEGQRNAAQLAQQQYKDKQNIPSISQNPQQMPAIPPTPASPGPDDSQKTNPGLNVQSKKNFEEKTTEIKNLLSRATNEQIQQILDILKNTSGNQ